MPACEEDGRIMEAGEEMVTPMAKPSAMRTRSRHLTLVLSSLLLLLLGLSALPAAAGTPAEPDIVDPCGEDAEGDRVATQPEADICAGWITAEVTPAGDVTLDLSIQTLAPTVENQRQIAFTFTHGDCTFATSFDNAIASPRPITFGDGGALFPDAHPVRVRVTCVPISDPCTVDPVPVWCITYERHAVVELPWEAVAIDGDVVTLTLDLADEALTTSEVAADLPGPGDTITGLYAQVHRTASWLVPPIGTVVIAGSSDYGNPLYDAARGDAFTIPLPVGS